MTERFETLVLHGKSRISGYFASIFVYKTEQLP